MNQLLYAISIIFVMTLRDYALAITINLIPTADAPIKQFMVDTNFRDGMLSTRSGTNNDQRTVMLFDLSSIPAGNIITSATLNLYGHSVLGATDVTSVSMFRITQSWLENEVTYRQAMNFTDWTHLGGDYVGSNNVYDADPYSTWTGPQSGAADAWYFFDATQLVQDWYDGNHANNGLLLRGVIGNELEYASSEATSEANRPFLQVSYVAVPEPASLTLLALGILHLFCRRRQ